MAARGREPGLRLERADGEQTLTDWGHELVAQCAPIAAALDAAHGGSLYSDAVQAAALALDNPDSLASARVLAAMQKEFDGSFIGFTRARSAATRSELLGERLSEEKQAKFAAMSAQSVEEQKAIEGADTMPFDIYLTQYLSPGRLGLKAHQGEKKSEKRAEEKQRRDAQVSAPAPLPAH